MPERRVWHFHDRFWLTIDWFPDKRLWARVRLALVTLWLCLTGGVDLGETSLTADGTYRLRILDSVTSETTIQDISRWDADVELSLQSLVAGLNRMEPHTIEERYFNQNGQSSEPSLLVES